MSIGVDGTGAVRHSFSLFDGVRTQPARYRHDNDRELPRTPNEIYELNRAMVRRMNEISTDCGIPVVPSLGTLVFFWSFCFEWMGCCVEALTLTTYVHTYEMLRCSTLWYDSLRDLRTHTFARVRPSTSVDGTLLVQATTISGVSTASCAFTGSRGLNFVSRFSWLRPRTGMRPYTAHVRFFILSA